MKQYRKLYEYICKNCKKKRSTLIYSRYVDGECTKCKRHVVDENQVSLFDKLLGRDK